MEICGKWKKIPSRNSAGLALALCKGGVAPGANPKTF